MRVMGTVAPQIRYNDWRVQHDIGWPDKDGVCRPRSVAQLAAIYRLSRPAVHDGIKVSRQVQAEIEAIGADRY
jgi:hypothetical protein